MPPSAKLPDMTPLAPSVEKAYYRKCIQLKRRLNEVEAANEEAKTKRMRLDRAIMKMRLERAFLLDELRRRMDVDIDGSDGSGEEGMATPPPDRPHRDKRRRHQQSGPTSSAPPTNSFQPSGFTPSAQRTAPDSNVGTPMVPGPGGQMVEANMVTEDGRYIYVDHAQTGRAPPANQPPALPHGSPYGPPPTGMPSANATNGMEVDGSNGRDDRPISREVGPTGLPLTGEDNGERAVPRSTTEAGHPGDQAFPAVNNQ